MIYPVPKDRGVNRLLVLKMLGNFLECNIMVLYVNKYAASRKHCYIATVYVKTKISSLISIHV